MPRPDPRATPGPWYLLKTETVGVERCPVHGHGHGEVEGGKYRKDKKVSIKCFLLFDKIFVFSLVQWAILLDS